MMEWFWMLGYKKRFFVWGLNKEWGLCVKDEGGEVEVKGELIMVIGFFRFFWIYVRCFLEL